MKHLQKNILTFWNFFSSWSKFLKNIIKKLALKYSRLPKTVSFLWDRNCYKEKYKPLKLNWIRNARNQHHIKKDKFGVVDELRNQGAHDQNNSCHFEIMEQLLRVSEVNESPINSHMGRLDASSKTFKKIRKNWNTFLWSF